LIFVRFYYLILTFSVKDTAIDDDFLWHAFVAATPDVGHVTEDRSRYGGKPALFNGKREIAHCAAPEVIDLRAGWVRVRERLEGVLAIAVAGNG
jgi:hypothetical protein